MKLSKTFIPLPFSFDAGRLAEEALALPPEAWMTHPNSFKGNSAVALISKHGGDNNDYGGDMRMTPHLAHCPYHQQVMTSFGEVLARSRLMRLEGNSEVSGHIDVNYHWQARVRIHVPLITNPQVIFHCNQDEMHMKAGECWIFDSWLRHKVVNHSDETRIHLVIDLAGSSRFWDMVRKMEPFDRDKDKETIAGMIDHIPYTEGKEIEIRTEKYNTAPVMAPGELAALVEEVIEDFEGKPANDPKIVQTYKVMLRSFAQDWREVWHSYGFEKEGWPHYQKLIGKLRGGLHPDRRAITTISNDCGVNVIINIHLLQSALAVEELDAWVA